METKMLEQGGLLGIVISKIGLLKVLSLGAALIGAFMMAVFRPPKTRKEQFLQGAVALGCSILFGGTLVSFLDWWWDWINLSTATYEQVVQFNVTVHGLLGAFSWGAFGGMAVLSDKFSKNPTATVKEVKDVIS